MYLYAKKYIQLNTFENNEIDRRIVSTIYKFISQIVCFLYETFIITRDFI